MANNGIYYSSGNTLNFTTDNTTWATLSSGGTFVINTVSGGTYLNLPSGNFTGGTVSGPTIFTGGLSANTISATTYFNLPVSGLTEGSDISIIDNNGNFTISFTGSIPTQGITGITGTSGVSAATNNFGTTIINTAPDQTVTLTGGTNIQIDGTYPNFGVNFTGTTGISGEYLPLSGGTVTGGTVFTAGVTANTLSSIDYIDFDLLSGGTAASSVSRLRYVADEGGLVTTLLGGNIDLQIGQQNVVFCYNGDTVNLTKGQVVAIIGNQGNRPSIQRAIASAETTSSTALGVVAETINVGNEGFVTTFGNVRGFNLTGITPGSYLYLSPTTLGGFTGTQPQAPDHIVAIGYVVRTGTTQGEVFVSINNGWELNELHNVRITNPSAYDILQYSAGTTPVWYNTSTPFFSGLTSTTISATTYQNLPGSSSANCVTTFYVTNISGCSPVNVLSPLNVIDGLSVTGTSTFTNQVNFEGGISANTFSAATYQNLPSSFQSVRVDNNTQFSADTGTFLNFSGINITITSAATNTLVFSAGTGGGGGVTQIIAGTNITISPTGGTGNVTINSTGGGTGLGTVYTTANNFNFL
jgi:hypothetical protein